MRGTPTQYNQRIANNGVLEEKLSWNKLQCGLDGWDDYKNLYGNSIKLLIFSPNNRFTYYIFFYLIKSPKYIIVFICTLLLGQ